MSQTLQICGSGLNTENENEKTKQRHKIKQIEGERNFSGV